MATSTMCAELDVARARAARRRVASIVALMVFGAVGLSVALILATDLRRKQTAMTTLQNLLPVLRQQCSMGPGPALRTSAASPSLSASRAPDVTWADGAFDESSATRSGRMLVAYTEEFPRYLGTAGRAVLIYERPEWRVEWVTDAEFRGLKDEGRAISGMPGSTP